MKIKKLYSYILKVCLTEILLIIVLIGCMNGTEDIYQPDLQYRYFCLLDNQNQVHKFYYAPALEMVDCLSEESGCNLDKSVIRNVVLRKESIDGKDLFRIAGVKEPVVIVSLPMAESLLRRRPKGIRILHVEIV